MRNTCAPFDPDFAEQGWYANRDNFDFSSLDVPMSSIFLEGDTVCSPERSRPILDAIPSHGESITVTNTGRAHFNIVGDNDDYMTAVRLLLL